MQCIVSHTTCMTPIPPTTRTTWLRLLIATAGLLSVSSIALGTLLAFTHYRGPFSLLNLTISELGLPPASASADLFNGSLIAGGVCLSAFLVGLGMVLRGWSGALFALLGSITGLATALVGVFPVNHPLHQVVGPACFLSGLCSSGVFTLRLLVDSTPRFPRWLALPSLLAGSGIGLYMSMPLLLPDGMNQVFAAPDAATRPAVWIVAITEWLALCAVLLWAGIVAGYVGYNAWRVLISSCPLYRANK